MIADDNWATGFGSFQAILAYKQKYRNMFFVVYDLGFIRDVEKFGSHFEETEGVVVRVVKH